MNEYIESKVKYDEIKEIRETSHKNNQAKTKLKEINEDFLGWISVENTEIDYPVVLGENNDYYLDHNFYKEEDSVGSIFMDYRNSINPVNKHTIIYGHNMRDDSMFGTLHNVVEGTSSFEDHSISLEINGQNYKWDVFSAYETTESKWMKINFNSNEMFENLIDDSKNLSLRNSSIKVDESDQIITLAKCTTVESDERLVVHGKLKRSIADEKIE